MTRTVAHVLQEYTYMAVRGHQYGILTNGKTIWLLKVDADSIEKLCVSDPIQWDSQQPYLMQVCCAIGCCIAELHADAVLTMTYALQRRDMMPSVP